MAPHELEGEWLAALPTQKKMLFLASLSHELTIAGRSSYKPQTEELEKPSRLRRINEIQHRVASCLCQLITGQMSFEKSIAHWVLQQDDEEFADLLSWSWEHAKERTAKWDQAAG
ncbi:hypothetical protein [Undibacterium sp.]|uniref:hypothetical protein n=1 Tax=Undibacterium sp. TaxID=1914977 RepID=UPI002D7FC499|nr:hypothetical protein [Undibacterium sp.]